jgi:hypothetical protein
MIDELDHTIEQLLRSELDIDSDGIEISFSQPNGQWAGRRTGPTLNFFLYDVRENPTLRRHQWQPEQEQRSKPTRDGAVTFKRTPLMLDCFYVVTAWSGADEAARPLQEHMLLSRVLCALARYPVLNPRFEELRRIEAVARPRDENGDANGVVKVERRPRGQMTSESELQRRTWLSDSSLNPLAAIEVEVRTRIAHHDVLTNPAEIWSALEAQMKAGFSYVVTLPLDPWKPFEAYRVTGWSLRSLSEPLIAITGVIRNAKNVRQAQLRLQLLHGRADEHHYAAMPEVDQDDPAHRYITETNAKGEYHFSGLAPGAYTLLIVRSSGEIVVREFTLSPAGATGFDFTI